MDDQNKALFDVVARMPQTWECIRCHVVFPNNPDGEIPYAYEAKFDPSSGINRAVGNICRKCYLKD